MAWLAVDQMGYGFLHTSKPTRTNTVDPKSGRWRSEKLCVPISHEAIFEIVGNRLTWNDDPIQICVVPND